MGEDLKGVFEQLDEAESFEQPAGFDRPSAGKRACAFSAALATRLGTRLSVETGAAIQDASFHSEIELPGGRLRFSSFGEMVALTPDHEVPEDVVKALREVAVLHGYRFVPTATLVRPYTGRKAGVIGIRTWWIRFFDWA